MTREQQRNRREEAARRRRVRRVCRACVIMVAVGMGIAAALWYDGESRRGSAGWGDIPVNIENVKSSETEQEYPDSLLTLMEMNPETETFVLGYFQNRELHPEIDLSDEVEHGSIPLFLQWDQRWGYETYGSDFMAVTGCGPTCLSMVWCGLSGETQWDPLTVARFAEEEGYYVKGAGTAWDLMTTGAADLGLTAQDIVFDGDHILAWLSGGNPIICAMRPGDFTTTGHFIVLSGVDEYGRVKLCDPNSRNNSEKTWDVEDLIPQIKNLWAYRYEP